jgi:oligosaccharide repeat unit polymerase
LVPYTLGILLHSLGFSDFYNKNLIISVVIVYSMPLFLSVGILLALTVNGDRLTDSRVLNLDNLQNYSINFRVLFLIFTTVFLLETAIFGIPLFAGSPTLAYMNYGLPVIHHLITLIYFTIIFLVALKLSKKIGRLKFLFVFLAAITVFILILARMQLLNVILIALFSYYYFANLKTGKVVFYGSLVVIFFLTSFTFLGEIRTNAVSDYFVTLGQINNEAIYPFAQIYIYLTISIQNFIQLVTDIEYFTLGAYTFLSMTPLVDPSDLLPINLSNFKSSPGLTTFAMGSSFYIDFGIFSYIILFLLGYLSGYFYVQFRLGNILATLCYLGILVRVLIYGFFYDGFFVTNTIILLFAAFFFSYRLKFSKSHQ